MGDCEIIVGDSGIGKTRAVRKYADTYPSDTIVVTASSGTGNALSLLNEIGAQLGMRVFTSQENTHGRAPSP